jgi:hypothetical protein
MWQLTRLGPTTGASQSWDAGDDLAFARMSLVAPAAGKGVWLVDGDRLRLFDGQRFTRVLQVPASLLATAPGPATVGHVHDVLDTGSAVWVSVHDVAWDEQWLAKHKPSIWTPARRVLKWAEGTWTTASTREQEVGGYLSLDAAGALWAGGWFADQGYAKEPGMSTSEHKTGPRVLGKRGWRLPGANRKIAAQRPAGRSRTQPAACGCSTPAHRSCCITTMAAGTPSLPTCERRSAMTTLGLRINWAPTAGWPRSPLNWPADRTGPRGWPPTAGWCGSPPRGARPGTGRTRGCSGRWWPARSSPGGLLVADGSGVLGLDGDRFTRVYSDPLQTHPATSGLAALGADRVVVRAGNTWFAGNAGSWAAVSSPIIGSDAYHDCSAAVASDGAVWITDARGLARVVGDQSTVVTAGVRDCPRAPGEDGAVWVDVSPAGDDPGHFVAYAADGTARRVPYPEGPDLVCSFVGMAGRDGKLMVEMVDADCGDEGSSRGPAVWNGAAWSRIPAPPTGDGSREPFVHGMVATDDGAFWAKVNYGTIARFANGRWQIVATAQRPGTMSRPAAAPGGRVCAFWSGQAGQSAVVCFGPGGEVARFDTSGMAIGNVSVSPHGHVWVIGPQVARIGSLT